MRGQKQNRAWVASFRCTSSGALWLFGAGIQRTAQQTGAAHWPCEPSPAAPVLSRRKLAEREEVRAAPGTPSAWACDLSACGVRSFTEFAAFSCSRLRSSERQRWK